MEIHDILSPDAVFELREANKSRVLDALARRAAALLGIDAAATAQALTRREDLGSTGLGHGVALPHARIAGLEQPFGLFARLKPAVPFDSIDERPVDLVFLLLLPERFPEGQLKAMAFVSRTLRDPIVSARLRAAHGSAALSDLLIGTG